MRYHPCVLSIQPNSCGGTGDHPDLADYKTVERHFAGYIIKILLTRDGTFVKIRSIEPAWTFQGE